MNCRFLMNFRCCYVSALYWNADLTVTCWILILPNFRHLAQDRTSQNLKSLFHWKLTFWITFSSKTWSRLALSVSNRGEASIFLHVRNLINLPFTLVYVTEDRDYSPDPKKTKGPLEVGLCPWSCFIENRLSGLHSFSIVLYGCNPLPALTFHSPRLLNRRLG